MRKGVIRIVTGSVMMFLQLAVLFFQADMFYLLDFDSALYAVVYLLGYFSVGICGAILFFFGVRAFKSGRRVELIIHKSTKA